MSRHIGYLFTLGVPVAAVALAAAWMLDLGAGGGATPVYETVEATKGSIRKLVSTSGPVRALVTVSVGSQLSGQVEQVKVDFNDEVKPGDVLAVLDTKTFAAKVTQARADLSAAEAGVTNQEAALTKAEAVLKLAEQNIERQKTLAAKGYASRATLDSATRDSDVARADIAVAKAQIESAKATIKQRQAALEQTEIDLERTEVRSPIEGTVISRTVDPGQTVAASLQAPELFKIAQDLSSIRIEAQVNEADVGSIAEGNPVTFTVDAYPERQFAGRVTQVRLSATELNNVVTYTVIIEAANEDRKLFPGMTANVAIESAKRDGVLRVPNDAFRFKPRQVGPEASNGAGGRGADRAARALETLKRELELTPEQEAALSQALAKLATEEREGEQAPFGGRTSEPSAQRQRLSARIDQALAPLLTDAQRPAYEEWKRGRESTRRAVLWVLGSNGQLERRAVVTGLADDQMTEIVGGKLKEGDEVVLRTRSKRS